MRTLLAIALTGAMAALSGADWSSESGNPQRDGWARGETEILKENVQGLQFLYKMQLDNRARGLESLTTPIVLTNLITYRGFKEMLFLGGSSGNVYSVDAALDRLLWKTHFDSKTGQPDKNPTPSCPGGLTASIAITGGSSPMVRTFRPAVKPAAATGANPSAAVRDPEENGIFSSGFGRNGFVFAIGGDGYLRFVRQSDGNDAAFAPVKFVPPNSKVSAINVFGTTVYAATTGACGGAPNAVYAVDLGGPERNVVSFPTNGGGPSGAGGTAIGANGTVYIHVENGHGDVAGVYNGTVLALNPKDLSVEDYFTPSGPAPATRKGPAPPEITPAIFQWKGKDVIVAAGNGGVVYLLSAASLGGPDHNTPLSSADPVALAGSNFSGYGLRGDFSTWVDPESGARWIYAALHGPAAANFPTANGPAPNGAIVAFKVEERNGLPALTPQWISRDLLSPASPITTNGLVFALSSGESSRLAKENGALYSFAEREKMAAHATLYALDGATGKELFSSGAAISSFSHNSGLALANGRVYFTTRDNTVYCYGFPAREPQLTER